MKLLRFFAITARELQGQTGRILQVFNDPIWDSSSESASLQVWSRANSRVSWDFLCGSNRPLCDHKKGYGKKRNPTFRNKTKNLRFKKDFIYDFPVWKKKDQPHFNFMVLITLARVFSGPSRLSNMMFVSLNNRYFNVTTIKYNKSSFSPLFHFVCLSLLLF